MIAVVLSQSYIKNLYIETNRLNSDRAEDSACKLKEKRILDFYKKNTFIQFDNNQATASCYPNFSSLAVKLQKKYYFPLSSRR